MGCGGGGAGKGWAVVGVEPGRGGLRWGWSWEGVGCSGGGARKGWAAVGVELGRGGL